MAFDSPENINNAVKIFYHENWRIGFFSLTLLCIGKCIAIGGTGGQSPKGKKGRLFDDWTISRLDYRRWREDEDLKVKR